MKKLFAKFATRKNASTLGVALVLLAAGGLALAGTGGTEFDTIYQTLLGWIQGTLGKVIALTALAVGLTIGIMRQSIMAVVVGIAMSMALYYGPTVIEGVVAAALPL
jgi:conjugal transfer pilus assembly protein TraA